MYSFKKEDKFNEDVKQYFALNDWDKPKIKVHKLIELYNKVDKKKSLAPRDKDVVYALFNKEDTLMKIGKATEKIGKMFHRMSSYSKFREKYIDKNNINDITVKYVEVGSNVDAWALERYCQAMAYSRGYDQPCENKVI